MAYHFPTPPMTSFLKSTRGPLLTTNVWGGPWKWRSWSRPSGIITGRSPFHPATVLHAGVKPPRRRNPSAPLIRTICSMCPGETSVTLLRDIWKETDLKPGNPSGHAWLSDFGLIDPCRELLMTLFPFAVAISQIACVSLED